MVKNKEMKNSFIKSERALILAIVILSVLITIAIAFFINHNLYKYNFVLKTEAYSNEKAIQSFTYYSDFDNNGNSEKLQLVRDDIQNHSSIVINNEHGKQMAQFNFQNTFFTQEMLFIKDYNSDGWKEIFLTTIRNDSLFLNIIDTKTITLILKNRLIYVRPNIRKKYPWDVAFFGNTLDANNDGTDDLLLTLNAYYSLHPRGFITYDIKNDLIIDTLFTKSIFYPITVSDINSDGTKEIISGSSAYGNNRDTTGYSDNAAWFFVLKNNLQFLFPPKQYGTFGTKVKASIIEEGKNKKFLLSVYGINDSLDAKLQILSKTGNVVKEKFLTNKVGNVFRHIIVAGNPYIIDYFSKNYIKIYNQNLDLVSELKITDTAYKFQFAFDLDGDGVEELCFLRGENIIITDVMLNTIAQVQRKTKTSFIEPLYFGKNKLPGISIGNSNFHKVYALETSFANKYFIPLLFISNVLIFLLLLAINLFIAKVSIFFHSFIYFIKESSSALLIVNPNGKIIVFNKQLVHLIANNNLKKGKQYLDSFSEQNAIKTNIEYALQNQQKLNKKISFQDKTGSILNGVIEITPFKSFWGYTFVYLIKIVDKTEDIINERIQVWSHTAQKLAHEIKSPLGSIQLNLSALKKRLTILKVNETKDIDEDISIINEQILRMKNLISSFLKVTNLEKSSIQPQEIELLINSALLKFKGYLAYGISIKFNKPLSNIKIQFDKNQFVEVIQIIVENSIDAMEGKGTISISHTTTNNTLELHISDTGVGIEPINLHSVFDPYFTTKEEGTGLGLAFAKKIMEDNNGSIKIESDVSKGTKIILRMQQHT